jgi:hypothetical protein
MDDFEREACRRLPLAEASLRLLDYVTHDDLLASVFREHHGPAYEKKISFPLFVHLIADAVLEHDGSGHQSFTRAKEQGTLAASERAMYGKLARAPIDLSRGFLAETTRRLHDVFPPVRATVLPASLHAFRVVALDGKKLKHVAKRLKALRKVKGHVLGGKLVVALDMATGLAMAMDGDPDGEVSDAPLVPGVLAQVRAMTQGPCLYVSDRQFCDLTQPQVQGQNGDHWLIRYNAKVSFHPDSSRPQRLGEDAQGRAYTEEWGWLGKATDKRRQYVRRITLHRPGDEDVIVVTDLVDAEQIPAADLLEVYGHRWGIERMFQRVTEVFNLRTLIGGTPQATVFQAAFCFLLYNVVMVLRAYLAEARDQKPEAISSENLFDDVQRQLLAWQQVIGPQATFGLLGPTLATGPLRRRVKMLLKPVWSDRWLKAPPRKITPKHPDKKEYLKGGHTSVYRLLQKAREAQRITDVRHRK